MRRVSRDGGGEGQGPAEAAGPRGPWMEPLLELGVCSQPPPPRGHFPSTLPPDPGRTTVQRSLGGWVAQSKQASIPPATLSKHDPSAAQPVWDPVSRSCLPHAG